MKFNSICAAISLLLLSTYAAVIPFSHDAEFHWSKRSDAKSFSVDLKSPSRLQASDLNARGQVFDIYDNGKDNGAISVASGIIT